MKQILTALVCLLLAASATLAQKAPIKFGDIPMEDMKMTLYAKDSSAEAVVLADYGVSTMEYSATEGFHINFERIRRIKILTKEGLSHADFSIPLYHDGDNEERITGLKLVTYNLENGKIVETKAKNDSFFKEETDKNLDIMKVAWINVKEGSVIEISYKIRSDFVFNFQDWEFQSTIPVRWSEYRATIPEYFNYQKYMQGYVPLTINEKKSQTGSILLTYRGDAEGLAGRGQLNTETVQYAEDVFRWAVQDVQAFRMEPFITTANDYVSKLNFELAYTKYPQQPVKNYMGTWEDINRSYWNSVKDEVTASGGLKDDVAAATAGATTDEEKVGKIFNYVRQNVLWDERYRKYPDQSPKKVLDTKKGSSADINLLLAAMIGRTGISVYPVLISTRNHGFVREEIPVSSQFNYVICAVKIGEKTILLDATSRMLPFGVIPERCLNGKGLIVSEGNFSWVDLLPVVKSRTMYNAEILMTDAGELTTTLKVDKTGYHSASARNQYLVKGETDYMKDFTGQRLWNVSKSEFTNMSDIGLPFKETHQLTVNDHITSSNNTIYFNPFIIGREDENPFKTEVRQYPVDFGNTFDQLYLAKIVIPDGYVIEELPKSKVVALPENAARYSYSLTQAGNVINVASTLSINRSLFSQDQYPNLREFYNQMIAKQAEQVVLKKK